MKERPILFSGEMVRAILDGRKTQTRRIMKPQPEWKTAEYRGVMVGGRPAYGTWIEELYQGDTLILKDGSTSPYPVGTRLWVRETFYAYGEWERVPDEDGKLAWHFVDRTIEAGKRYQYVEPESLTKRRKVGVIGWYRRPSIFMPRWASRILLEVTDVRVERLRDISDEDSLAEGIQPTKAGKIPGAAKQAYKELWEHLNGSGSWEANPWVWAISFKVLEKGMSCG